MRHSIALIAVIFLLLSGCNGEHGKSTDGIVISEASGITRIDDRLLIVGDDADGRYFELSLDGTCSTIIAIAPEKVREILMPGAELAMDLEGIDVLTDGRIVVLSEQLHSLILKRGKQDKHPLVVAEYDKTLTEFGHRGLEGLAVKHLDSGVSRVAVLWEGGYLIDKHVPPQLREKTSGEPLKPVIVVHEIESDGYAGKVDDPTHRIVLDVPEPPGEPPDVQRYRATDLVWFESQKDKDIFIVLLNSENAPQDGAVEYIFKILQRFDLQGNRIGEPLYLDHACKNALKGLSEDDLERMGCSSAKHLKEIDSLLQAGNWENVNWEGMGWFEEGKSLVIIYDAKPKDPPFAFVIEIPEEWL